MKNKKTVALITSVVLAVVLVLSGTFAWFTAQDSVTNKLKTTDSPAGAEIVEVFTPADDWKPGQTVVKEVGVVNTGESPVLTRLHFTELLQLMKPQTAETSVFSGPIPTAITDKYPSLFDAGNYVNASGTPINGWQVVTITPNASLGGLKLSAAAPTGVIVLAKMSTSGTTAANNIRSAYNFTVFGQMSGAYTGKYQRTNIEFDFDSATKTITLTGPGGAALGANFLVHDGKYEFTADWSATAPTLADIVKAITEGSAADPVVADINGSYIKFNYDASRNQTLAQGTWFYEDGYFYWVDKLMPGTATANLLSSLTLNSAATNAYANMNFELTVIMDAIQNTQDAVIALWNPSAALLAALTPYCE